MKQMTVRLEFLLIFIVTALASFAIEPCANDSIMGRPFKEFSTTAFCSYSSFHPSQYIADNNWDILCVFRNPGPLAKLDSLNIPYNKSQLRLLMVGDLLSFSDGKLQTKMPIFDKAQTERIRSESKAFADSIFPAIEPKIKELITAFKAKGYGSQIYSLIFSYLLDGYVWSDGKLPLPDRMADHGTWSGAYWAMWNKRLEDRNGTNGYGPLKVNWTDELGYWPSDKMLLSFARCIMDNQLPVRDEELKSKLMKWNLVDSDGQPAIPIIKSGNKDEIDLRCEEITTQISNAIKNYVPDIASGYNILSQEEASVVFYHEVMWDILTLLESKGIIAKPAILKGEEVGAEHFSDIAFIVLQEENDE
ncbi:hypothetical protein [uncultured Duncaniella sp.]|uniref:hypothetical protein n=2 Tax=uncultured Duncaniella sp. TaxID=2768039 RepID=UPI0026393269|nr:hypothetical protein [uncultured Duncaniella sp.]